MQSASSIGLMANIGLNYFGLKDWMSLETAAPDANVYTQWSS